jgi:hypothetical protein
LPGTSLPGTPANRSPIAEPAYRGRVTDVFLPKIEEWIEASKGKIRADKAHQKLRALGYDGRNARPAGPSPRSAPPGGLAMSGCTGRGTRNRACGFSTTSATEP